MTDTMTFPPTAGREGRTILGTQAKPLKWLYLGNRSEKDTYSYKVFLLRMTDTMTSQNIVLSSRDTLYNLSDGNIYKYMSCAFKHM
jgi:uncharacterized cupin superfamily protein